MAPKLCINCKHFFDELESYPQCSREMKITNSLINGGKHYQGITLGCARERHAPDDVAKSLNLCGVEGKFYEPKEG